MLGINIGYDLRNTMVYKVMVWCMLDSGIPTGSSSTRVCWVGVYTMPNVSTAT